METLGHGARLVAGTLNAISGFGLALCSLAPASHHCSRSSHHDGLDALSETLSPSKPLFPEVAPISYLVTALEN